MELMELSSSSLRLGLDGSEKGAMKTADISSSTIHTLNGRRQSWELYYYVLVH